MDSRTVQLCVIVWSVILTPWACQDSVQISQVLPHQRSWFCARGHCQVETGKRQTADTNFCPRFHSVLTLRFPPLEPRDQTRRNRPRTKGHSVTFRIRTVVRYHPVRNINTPAQVNSEFVNAVRHLHNFQRCLSVYLWIPVEIWITAGETVTVLVQLHFVAVN